MPELPEVYTMTEGLKRLIGRKIASVWADKPRILSVVRKTEGRKILSVARKGKNIIFSLDKGLYLLIHPRMTGKFLLNMHDKYERIIFNFMGDDFLTFSDKRRFGNVILSDKKSIGKILNSIGEDALNISFENFKSSMNLKKGKIKSVLMNQGVISGIGNIYADEILWESKIHPKTQTNLLLGKELKNIFLAMRLILKKSIKLRGVSIQDYRDIFGNPGKYQDHCLVYGRAGKKCLRCKTKIQKIKIAQRPTHFCPRCQTI